MLAFFCLLFADKRPEACWTEGQNIGILLVPYRFRTTSPEDSLLVVISRYWSIEIPGLELVGKTVSGSRGRFSTVRVNLDRGKIAPVDTVKWRGENSINSDVNTS